VHDSGTKTPLIIIGPGSKSGRLRSLVSSIEIPITFLEFARADTSPRMQGACFEPFLLAPEQPTCDFVFAERNWQFYQAHERAVRTGDWLYIGNNQHLLGQTSPPA
jgi:arylsulfatase